MAVAAAGGLVAFALGQRLDRLAGPITVLDAIGLSLFAVTGASKTLGFGLGVAQAIILGAITAVHRALNTVFRYTEKTKDGDYRPTGEPEKASGSAAVLRVVNSELLFGIRG